MRHLLVMLEQQVFPEIIGKIPPYCMDMVVVVLGIVVFQEESRPLHPVVMRFSALHQTGPAKKDLVRVLTDFSEFFVRKLRPRANCTPAADFCQITQGSAALRPGLL